MSLTLRVPDSVARSLRIPERETEARLRCELALSLYSQELLSFGKAAELAAVSRYRFADLLTERHIPRPLMDMKNLPKTSHTVAVSDTSVVSNLALIGRLHLLRTQFDTVWIPEAVGDELTRMPDAQAQTLIMRPKSPRTSF